MFVVRAEKKFKRNRQMDFILSNLTEILTISFLLFFVLLSRKLSSLKQQLKAESKKLDDVFSRTETETQALEINIQNIESKAQSLEAELLDCKTQLSDYEQRFADILDTQSKCDEIKEALEKDKQTIETKAWEQLNIIQRRKDAAFDEKIFHSRHWQG